MPETEQGGPQAQRGAGGRPENIGPLELATLASLELRARVIVEGAFSGMHHNLHPGTSIEFTEHKEYAPGDEIPWLPRHVANSRRRKDLAPIRGLALYVTPST